MFQITGNTLKWFVKWMPPGRWVVLGKRERAKLFCPVESINSSILFILYHVHMKSYLKEKIQYINKIYENIT